jgi:hypothetical protein
LVRILSPTEDNILHFFIETTHIGYQPDRNSRYLQHPNLTFSCLSSLYHSQSSRIPKMWNFIKEILYAFTIITTTIISGSVGLLSYQDVCNKE